METNILDTVFSRLGVSEPAKLGVPNDRNQAEINYAERRKEVQAQLKAATLLRAQTISRLNVAFYVIIAIIVISIGLQFFVKGSNIILFIQTACVAVLFPISRQIERSVTKQSYMEFVSAFLPDLEPKEAITAIDHLYQSISDPDKVKATLNATPAPAV